MADIKLQSTKRVVPMIYAYTTPEIKRHEGSTKIGYTEQDVDKRLSQQTHTADVLYHEEWRGNAVFDDGTGEIFSDKDFHRYLRKLGVANDKNNEWFKIDGPTSKKYFNEFRSNRGILSSLEEASPYTLRDEQNKAVEMTKDYLQSHDKGEFLWNAKPRFGKTLSVYDFCKRIDAKNVLIVTNRPAIANSWYSDYEKFMGPDSGYSFVSSTDSLAGKKYVLTREQYTDALRIDLGKKRYKCIEFVSLQDLKGSLYFGGQFNKLKEIKELTWDVLVVDEAHEGVDTYKTDIAFDQIKRRFTLHLSGTPFKALANSKFADGAIYNWTYADEQSAKRNWGCTKGDENPYANLPRLNMFTYQMSDIIKDELEHGVEINGETEEYAFDLNLFFETKNGRFVHEASVDHFLDALTQQTKFPFSTEELRNELKHTFWLLNRVESAKALAKKLQEHEVFKDYEIVLAAGDGKLDDAEETQKSFDKVKKAIQEHDKTITISVGQLTTGVTVPEWTGVLMLSNIKSPALYMQAAFRAQNPCLFTEGGRFLRKENAYVFDFDPARTLTIFEEFANDLSTSTAMGRGDTEERKQHIMELLNFFPVIGEDENGEMVELDAEKVLSIPRKIRSVEVVRRGFMSDFLFQNISNVFRAPQEVINIINSFTAVQEPSGSVPVTGNTADDLSLDEDGEVKLGDDYVIGKSTELFGDRIYGESTEALKDAVDRVASSGVIEQDQLEELKDVFHTKAADVLINAAKIQYGSDLTTSDKNKLERTIKSDSDSIINKACGDYDIKRKTLEQERKDKLEQCQDEKSEAAVNKQYDNLQTKIAVELKKTLADSADKFIKSSGETIVRTVETRKKEQEKHGMEDNIKDHLRGFTRTIPSFLMAYGNDEVTLQKFDTIIPDDVFKQVTSITLDQFRFLRDGGLYVDPSTGEKEIFSGNIFDQVVFDDSIKEFLRRRKTLADYFAETATEDIFDYIPPQKTNQIFTPKVTVKKMVDMLEEENPGCFDNPDKTFIDLYMKSGLYITEIVKRLYQSKKMQQLFPDGKKRLKHIFEKQVYGLAPTEIIYKIATNYILGFDKDVTIEKHNFRMADALEYAKQGNLEQKLDELYGKKRKK